MAPSAAAPAATAAALRLHIGVISYIDVGRLTREIKLIDEFMEQAALRKGGTNVTLPRMSKMLHELADFNQVNLLQKPDRVQLLGFLAEVTKKAPVLHFSFASEPSLIFLQKLTAWLRAEINPLALVQVGLQPTLAAGCMLRTTNHVFDFSMRQYLLKKRDILVKLLSDLPATAAKPKTPPASAHTPAGHAPAAPKADVPAHPVATAPTAAATAATVHPGAPMAPELQAVAEQLTKSAGSPS